MEWLRKSMPHSGIQVCFTQRKPEEQFIDNWNRNSAGGEQQRGCTLLVSVLVKIEASHPASVLADFKKHLPFILTSLETGDNVYVHCVSGLSRGPLVASLLSALLLREPVLVSFNRIKQLRNIHVYPQTDRDGVLLKVGLDLEGGIVPLWASRMVDAPVNKLPDFDVYAFNVCLRMPLRRMHAVRRNANAEPRLLLCKINHRDNNRIIQDVEETYEPGSISAQAEAFCPKCFFSLTASKRLKVRAAGHDIPKN